LDANHVTRNQPKRAKDDFDHIKENGYKDHEDEEENNMIEDNENNHTENGKSELKKRTFPGPDDPMESGDKRIEI